MKEQSRQDQSREALQRVGRESETLGGSGIARAGRRLGDHFAGRDADAGDPVEVWGRRIGRALSLLGVAVLAYLLGTQLRLW